MIDVLTPYVKRVDLVLHALFEKTSYPSETIKEAMVYSLFPGGKRLRPTLVYLVGELFEVNATALDAIAAAIEMTHAYSLIHDDLPAMDNDDFRRGKPSCHKAFSEATAILAGDALQAFAIEHLTQTLPDHLGCEITLNLINILTKATGPSGMISGQALDLYLLNTPDLTQSTLETIHHLKTGLLIEAAIMMPVYASRHNVGWALAQHTALLDQGPTYLKDDTHTKMQDFASKLGFIFQVQDDYLDAYAHPSTTGKNRRSDSVNDKTTFTKFYTQIALKDKLHLEYQTLKVLLEPFGASNAALMALIDGLESRLNC